MWRVFWRISMANACNWLNFRWRKSMDCLILSAVNELRFMIDHMLPMASAVARVNSRSLSKKYNWHILHFALSKTFGNHKIYTVVNFKKHDVVTSFRPKIRSGSEGQISATNSLISCWHMNDTIMFSSKKHWNFVICSLIKLTASISSLQ